MIFLQGGPKFDVTPLPTQQILLLAYVCVIYFMVSMEFPKAKLYEVKDAWQINCFVFLALLWPYYPNLALKCQHLNLANHILDQFGLSGILFLATIDQYFYPVKQMTMKLLLL